MSKKVCTVRSYTRTDEAQSGKYPCGKCPGKEPESCSNWRTCPAYRIWFALEWQRIRRAAGKVW